MRGRGVWLRLPCFILVILSVGSLSPAAEVPPPAASSPDPVPSPTAAPAGRSVPKLRASEFEVRPLATFLLPDGMVRLQAGLEELGPVALLVESRYNFINSDMEYKLHYKVSLGRPALGGSVYESLDFESLFEEDRSINRRRGGGLDFSMPLGGAFSARALAGGEQHLFIPLRAEPAARRSWTLNWAELQAGISTNRNEGPRNLGGSALVSLRRGFPQFSGSFDFVRLSATAQGVLSWGRSLDLVGQFGTSGFASARPVGDGPAVPFFEHDRLGGYTRLRGYRLDEFLVRETVWMRAEGRLAWPGKMPPPLWGWALDRLEAVASLDLAQGEERLWDRGVAGFRDAKVRRGVAGGLRLHFLYRARRRAEITALLSRALEPGRRPVFYLVHTFR